ncbi:S41 family peptidase [Tautonia plasticadhaerens]|uniref:Carboxy-terminal processing protease CtpB n=1 Tax=Tautonia plasticadhaerens TaxID=2527974 RepID=A0A518HBG1_9BACT|nr:S41 family peptidase [Tautonia plasticadhaerens]QDV38194.1 Carboxy-terminal processing protease CtpB precursor [Tautonia plasticadhaerens]
MPHRNLVAIAAVGLASVVCWQSSRGDSKDEMLELYGIFVDAVEQVESNYVREVPRRELLEAALQGMLQSLDPHSTYYSEAEWKQFQRTFEGSFTGIGIQVEVDARSKRLKVLAPLIGTPAYEAGVLAGDLILEVDGESTEGITQDKAVELLQGRPGTAVTLNVLHPGSEKAETLEVTREVIASESVLGVERRPDDSWEYFIDPEAKVGYIRISSFYQTTAEDVRAALTQLKGEGMRGLILDLRTNPGGLLSAAVEVSDLFVDGGVIVSTRGRNTRERRFLANADGTSTGFPMVVMVNQHSASAAEIVSACLQDAGRAKVVGERSFGKGSVQNIIPLEGGTSFLKLTVESYFRPSGGNIHKFPDATEEDEWGVSPSEGLAVELSPEEYARWELARRRKDVTSRIARRIEGDENDDADPPPDRQLDKALEVLHSELDDQAQGEDAEDEVDGERKDAAA